MKHINIIRMLAIGSICYAMHGMDQSSGTSQLLVLAETALRSQGQSQHRLLVDIHEIERARAQRVAQAHAHLPEPSSMAQFFQDSLRYLKVKEKEPRSVMSIANLID